MFMRCCSSPAFGSVVVPARRRHNDDMMLEPGEVLGVAVCKWASENREVFKICYKKGLLYDVILDVPDYDEKVKMAIYGPHLGAPRAIKTLINGQETSNTLGHGDFLVCGAKAEQYVVRGDRMHDLYTKENPQQWRSKSTKRFGTVVTAERLRALGASEAACTCTSNDDPAVCKIMASWGLVSLVPGGVLIADDKPSAYYVIDRDTFTKTYEPCDWCQ